MHSINYNRFGEVTLLIQSLNVTKETLPLLNIGDICLKREDREYHIETSGISGDINDKGVIEISIDLGTFGDALLAYEDSKFDLNEGDLTHKDLFTTVFIGSDEKGVELTFISGQIEVDFGTRPQEYITINASDEIDQKDYLENKLLTNKVAKRFSDAVVLNAMVKDTGLVLATVDGVKNTECGWIEEYELVSTTTEANLRELVN